MEFWISKKHDLRDDNTTIVSIIKGKLPPNKNINDWFCVKEQHPLFGRVEQLYKEFNEAPEGKPLH